MQPTSDPKLRLRTDAVRGAMAARSITTYEQLADRLDISLSTVKRVMRGEQQPSAAFIAAVCVHLGLEFAVFLDVQAPVAKPRKVAA